MNNNLANYVNYIFRNAPQSKEAMELSEEILQNITEKYNDLIDSGESEDSAFNKAIASIGDVNELIDELGTNSNKHSTIDYTKEEIAASKKRKGMFTSIAIMLYIISLPVVIIFDEYLNNGTLGAALMFTLIAFATGLLVYSNATSIKADEYQNVVEEFKDYRENSENYRKKKEINSIINTTGIILYFIISFMTGAWYITWVIFIMIGLVQSIVSLVMGGSHEK